MFSSCSSKDGSVQEFTGPFPFSLMDITADQDTSGISVLRSFRLLRIFKLVRFMPALQRQLSVMVRTLDNVMTFLALLLLFIFTSSILGMHLFGGKYRFKDESGQLVTSRANFDTLFWALVTVFQVEYLMRMRSKRDPKLLSTYEISFNSCPHLTAQRKSPLEVQ